MLGLRSSKGSILKGVLFGLLKTKRYQGGAFIHSTQLISPPSSKTHPSHLDPGDKVWTFSNLRPLIPSNKIMKSLVWITKSTRGVGQHPCWLPTMSVGRHGIWMTLTLQITHLCSHGIIAVCGENEYGIKITCIFTSLKPLKANVGL